MMQLPINPKILPATLIQFAEIMIKSNSKALSLKNVRLDLYSEEQIAALIKLIELAKPSSLSFVDNDLGTRLSFTSWQTLCAGLMRSSVSELIIDNNKLDSFSPKHWKVLEILVGVHPFNSISLQNNNLVNLTEKSHQALNSLVHRVRCPCLISYNNWDRNYNRWLELISLNPTNHFSRNRYSWSTAKTYVEEKKRDEERTSLSY